MQFTGGERSGTRWANSSITTNLVQYDRNVTVTVRVGQKVGNANTRDVSDAGLKAMVDEAIAEAQKANDSPNLPALLGANEELTLTVSYSGRLEPQSPDRETLGVLQDDGFGRGAGAQPSFPDDISVPRAEPSFLYSNRSFWYPQSTISDYATARITITASRRKRLRRAARSSGGVGGAASLTPRRPRSPGA